MSVELAIGSSIVIAGPTAIGKTALAVALSVAHPGRFEIVSADSIQVYRRFDIGSAKPTVAESSVVPFHLVNVAEPDQDFTVVDYVEHAQAALISITGRGRIPLIVGGTGLYIRALTRGLGIPVAGPDELFRAELSEIASLHGTDHLHRLLCDVDSVSAARIHENDLKRIIRALEVHRLTGKPLSEWHKEDSERSRPSPRAYLGLDRTRAELYKAIEKRAEKIFAEGIVAEVENLRSEGYGSELKPMTSLGYLQANLVLDGKLTLTEAIQQTQAATRQYGRRQLIWFRGESDVTWIDTEGKSVSTLAENLLKALGL